MGVLDKVLDVFKWEDYDDDDDFIDEEYESEYDDKPAKKGFLDRFKTSKENADEDYDYEDDATVNDKPIRASRPNKVTPMRQPSSRHSITGMEVCVIKQTSVEDSREIAETLLSGRTVILNLEGLDLDTAQRIIDFTLGATFAIDGNLQKISNYIILVTPTNVEISGDLQDLLGGSFDASTMRTGY